METFKIPSKHLTTLKSLSFCLHEEAALFQNSCYDHDFNFQEIKESFEGVLDTLDEIKDTLSEIEKFVDEDE